MSINKEHAMKTRVRYVRDSRNFPVAAVATVQPSPDKPGLLAVGISIFNPRDTFNKKLGRNIAVGRATAVATAVANGNLAQSAFSFKFDNVIRPFNAEILNECLRSCVLPSRIIREIRNNIEILVDGVDDNGVRRRCGRASIDGDY